MKETTDTAQVEYYTEMPPDNSHK